MSSIGSIIKQPLSFYDSVSKQNWRKENVHGSGISEYACIICPENAIIPFQLRRKRSVSQITTFDLYTLNGNDFDYNFSILSIIPAPLTNHLKIVQMQTVDNILWNPIADFIADLPCGTHYVHISDGVNNWYSELFRVVEKIVITKSNNLSIFTGANAILGAALSTNGTALGTLLINNKPL